MLGGTVLSLVTAVVGMGWFALPVLQRGLAALTAGPGRLVGGGHAFHGIAAIPTPGVRLGHALRGASVLIGALGSAAAACAPG